MTYTLSSALICRTPVFSIDAKLEDNFEVLREYIRDASENLYKELSNKDLNNLISSDKRLYFALWKYFNRCKYRATPFGRFAAVSIVKTTTVQSSVRKKIILESEINPVYLRDWDDRIGVDQTPRFLTEMAASIQRNATIYKVNNTYRFISRLQEIYELTEVNQSKEIDWILEQTQIPLAKEELVKRAITDLGMSKRSFQNLLLRLIESQIIWSDKMINITGVDFFSRNNIIQNHAAKYFVTERNVISGDYNEPLLDQVKKVINYLHKNLQEISNASLNQFKIDFSKKFGHRFVPLNLALDPQLGIEYSGLSFSSQNSGQDAIEAIFKNETSAKISSKIDESPLIKNLRKIILQGNRQVKLEDLPSLELDNKLKLPNSLSVLYRKFEDKLVVQHIGGCTANILLGRFSLTNPNIEKLGLEISESERLANPNVEFFDVSYQAERHVDNINRRKHLYNFELPLTSFSTSNKKISADDVYLGIRDNELVLYSKKLAKRIVPRIPTAYNYFRADLSLYRFLSDLQNQSLRTELGISPLSLIPDLDHYSRITYKSLILCPECWLVPNFFLKPIIDNGIEITCIKLRSWLNKITDTILFRCGEGDRTIVFNKNIDGDVEMLAKYLQQLDKTVYIQEALISREADTCDEKMNYYAAEFLVSMIHTKQVYRGLTAKDSLLFECNTKRKLFPGSDWLYFEIYTHHIFSNVLLSRYILPFVKANRVVIKKWFFIRYEKGGHHIRLRLNVQQPDSISTLISSLNRTLADQLDSGLVSDIQIKTYDREIERYGAERIAAVERLFYLDSIDVLNKLKRTIPQSHLYAETLNLMGILIKIAFTNNLSEIDYLHKMVNNFNEEFKLDSKAFKLINSEYRTFNLTIDKYRLKTKKSHSQIVTAFKKCLSINSEKNPTGLIADIIHMHINRLFPANQRKHEAMLYQYLLKNTQKNYYRSTPPN